jgi:D-alanyl-D-alanine endopeptidase (penicillin-binding protein 7)
MTAMVVLDSKLAMEEAIELSTEDIDLPQEHQVAPAHRRALPPRRPAAPGAHGERQPRRSALGRNYPGGITAFVAR